MRIKNAIKMLFTPLSFFNAIFPKNKRLILLYSNLGFRDNVKAMYDYLIKYSYNEKYKIVCSINDYKKYKDNAPKNVRFVGNILGMAYFFRCSYMFYSFGKYPIKPAKAQKIVNLWHGMPLKTIGNLEIGCENNDYYYFTNIIATSDFFSDIMQKCFKCPKSAVIISGQPRCDAFFEKHINPEKLILWLPTYRTSDKLKSTNSEFKCGFSFPIVNDTAQLQQLNNVLSAYEYHLLIKPHPLQNKCIFTEKYSNISIVSEQEEDIYYLLMKSSALITDYSSVYFDYLMLDRPIGFTIDDIDNYSKSRGFVVNNPITLMPGEKITCFEELLGFINNVMNKQDNFSQQRKEINHLVNTHTNGGFCRDVLNAIGLK